MGGVNAAIKKGTAGGYRGSGSARGPIGQNASTGGLTGLNKNMLDNLNKQNRYKKKVEDEIEASLHLRASKGEITKESIPVDSKKFQPTNEHAVDVANGKKEEEKKPAPKLPPRMPKQNNENKNFGKVPKYLQKYQEEAKAKEDAIAEEKARKL